MIYHGWLDVFLISRIQEIAPFCLKILKIFRGWYPRNPLRAARYTRRILALRAKKSTISEIDPPLKNPNYGLVKQNISIQKKL